MITILILRNSVNSTIFPHFWRMVHIPLHTPYVPPICPYVPPMHPYMPHMPSTYPYVPPYAALHTP